MRRIGARLLLAALCVCAPAPLAAQVNRMPSAPEGRIEAGAPQFSVLGRESLGLESPPTDLHVLPDGRVLLIAGQEIAFGDGARWEVFRQDPETEPAHGLSVAVDEAGAIYQAVPGGFARVQFGEDGLWRLVPVASWPSGDTREHPVPRRVIQAGSSWYWHANSGTILAWRPGETARPVFTATAVETIVELDGTTYVSDRSAPVGALGGNPPRLLEVLNRSHEALVTCSLAFPGGPELVGTTAQGVMVLDSGTLRPLAPNGPIGLGRNIRDLRPTGGGVVVAAVENEGLVFFDRAGQVVQVLDRALDHRLARISLLRASDSGVVWGLGADAVLRVNFPSRVSHYEPLFTTGLMEAQPLRVGGELWFLSDRKAHRAVYDEHGRVTAVVPDTPAGQNLFMLTRVADTLLASTTEGAFIRRGREWVPFEPSVPNLFQLSATPVDGAWLYAGADELVWIWPEEDGGMGLERIPAPGLGSVYHAVTDRDGFIWIERGIASVGRIRPGRPRVERPVIDLFGERDGARRGWMQVFEIDGIARFNAADIILRHDPATQRIVPDEAFLRAFASHGTIVGRPSRDAHGRVWITTETGINLFEGTIEAPRLLDERVRPGFQPWFLTFEDQGVVWMHVPGRMARYDPHMPTPPVRPMRALITRLTLGVNHRTLLLPGEQVPPIPYRDNSIGLHFMAPGDAFSTAIGFEVMLDRGEGDARWLPAGASGATVFDRLKEGTYRFRVRPRAGGVAGEEATLAFTVLPPWYRTMYAYAGYSMGSLAILLFAAWLPAYLGRREQARLERLVSERTAELKASQDQLHRAVDGGMVGLWEFDRSRNGFTWNEQCSLIHGLPRETTGMEYGAWEQSLDPEDRPAVRAAIDAALDRRSELRLELRIVRPGGTVRWIAIVGRAEGGGANDPVRLRGAMLDITERKESEEAIRLLNTSLERHVRERTAALEASNRELAASNRELESFSYSVSHDLRAPLRGIDGWSLALLEDYGTTLDATARDYIGRVRRETQRLGQLIDDLLKLSRTTRSECRFATFDLSALAQATAARVAEGWPDRQVEIVCQPGLVAVGDPALIEAALTNLFDNAWKFTGRVAHPRVEFGQLPPDRGAAYFVRDNGAGFDMRHAGKLFGVFQRMHTQDEFPGTGVGLATVQRIIHRHGGRIWAESRPGVETVFFFTLDPFAAQVLPSASSGPGTPFA